MWKGLSRGSSQASVLMQRLSYPNETVLSNKITRHIIILSSKDSPRKPLGRRPHIARCFLDIAFCTFCLFDASGSERGFVLNSVQSDVGRVFFVKLAQEGSCRIKSDRSLQGVERPVGFYSATGIGNSHFLFFRISPLTLPTCCTGYTVYRLYRYRIRREIG